MQRTSCWQGGHGAPSTVPCRRRPVDGALSTRTTPAEWRERARARRGGSTRLRAIYAHAGSLSLPPLLPPPLPLVPLPRPRCDADGCCGPRDLRGGARLAFAASVSTLPVCEA